MSKERPLIGVSTSEMREQLEQRPQGEPPRREMALGIKYLRAIEEAGGIPLVMPPLRLDAVEPLLDRLSGICLPGGPDLSSEIYGQSPHARLGPTEPELDLFELAVAKAADEREMPILAVCRGLQALNVARGGTLFQDLPDEVGGPIQHRQTEQDGTSHAVCVAPDSRLAAILGASPVEVNSFHHQSVRELGAGLRAVAWAADGVIEGVEDGERPFTVGVQWHAEGIVDRLEQARLFAEFVTAGQRYGARERRVEAA